MPVITFANSKGGSGKTTSSLLLACALAQNTATAIVDADPRKPLASWKKKSLDNGTFPKNLTVVSDISEDNITKTIEGLAEANTFVAVDLEGLASRMMSFAISRSDYIIVPCKEQQQDVEAALDVLKKLGQDFDMLGRRIPFALLFTMTKYVKSRSSRAIIEQLKNSPINVFRTEITERDPFSQIFMRGGTIYDLDKKVVTNIDKAIEEVDAFTLEVVDRLKQARQAAA
ncbi:ParA family protein [Asticcacaulis excentricus]|uniref:Putative partition protein ParA n=1 Tax=Asticcacaulis excentricus (strain ATCC 15261 / DSM 4724 / KCTC 12464 / NCIMB 9791 / VKM B-1370 / CB 48) TaxID=573065 RepID=E8RVW3_ASTEC|nr:ParA family protein [Asticcacaulis excentricus]ADU15385.1 putative partition protein ParA [Asticcacaulis excentricus CB 48]